MIVQAYKKRGIEFGLSWTNLSKLHSYYELIEFSKYVIIDKYYVKRRACKIATIPVESGPFQSFHHLPFYHILLIDPPNRDNNLKNERIFWSFYCML